MRIRELYVIGKTPITRDFTLLKSNYVDPPEAIINQANFWLQTLISSRNVQLVAISKIENELWFLRASIDVGTDSSGRTIYYIVFGKLEEVSSSGLFRLLLKSFDLHKPSKVDISEFELEVSTATPNKPVSSHVKNLLLALALNKANTIIVEKCKQASWLLQQITFRNIDFIALMEDCSRGHLPDGKGIIVSQTKQTCDDFLTELNLADVDFSSVNFADFLLIDCSESDKTSIFKAGVVGTPVDLSAVENSNRLRILNWLLDSPAGRSVAFENVDSFVVSEWLRKGRLSKKDLLKVKSYIQDSDRDVITNLLGRSREALEIYLEIFGANSKDIELVLPESALLLFRELSSDFSENKVFGFSHDDILLLDQSGILARLTTVEMAKLVKTNLYENIHDYWWKKMRSLGMPEKVFSVFFKNSDIIDLHVDGLPAPAPSTDWVQAIDKDILWDFGNWACKSANWMYWWVELIRTHPDFGETFVPSLEMEWSLVLEKWIVTSLSIGDITVTSLLNKFNEIFRSNSDLKAQERLLKEAGLIMSDGLKQILDGDLPNRKPSEKDIADLKVLIENDIVARELIQEKVLQGSDLYWSKAIGVDRACFSLLDLSLDTVAEPPPQWHSYLNSMLAKICAKSEFWERFNGFLSLSMVNWLVEQTQNCEGGVRVRAIKQLYIGKQVAALEIIKLVYAALPEEIIYTQIVAWQLSTSSEKGEALALLLSSSTIPSSLKEWLKTKLLTLYPINTAPVLSVPQYIALLPILSPIRDILRPLFVSQEANYSEEELAIALFEKLSSVDFTPIPPPNKMIYSNHKEIVIALSKLPQWELWAESVKRYKQEEN